MKKIIFGLSLVFALVIYLNGVVFAQTTPVPTLNVASEAGQKVDYLLPYPGILPDHPLYFLKMVRDRILDLVIREPSKKTDFLILMADKRLGAGKTLIDYNRVDLGETTIAKGENYLLRAVDTVSQARQNGQNINNLLDKLEKASAKHVEVLLVLQEKVSAPAKEGLSGALKNAQDAYQRVLELKKK